MQILKLTIGVLTLLLMASCGISGSTHSEGCIDEPAHVPERGSIGSQDAPPFVAPPQSTPVFLMGLCDLDIGGIEHYITWRIFSPNLTQEFTKDRWLSFDMIWDTPELIDDISMILTDPIEGGTTTWTYPTTFNHDLLTLDEEFIQYLGYRSSTYFYFNSSRRYTSFPKVEVGMLLELQVMVEGHSQDVFNITLRFDSKTPRVDIIGSGWNETINSYNVTREDPSIYLEIEDLGGISVVELNGMYSTDPSGYDYLLLCQVVDAPTNELISLTISEDLLQSYIALTHQEGLMEIRVIAVLFVYDYAGNRYPHIFDIYITEEPLVVSVFPMLITIGSIVTLGPLIAIWYVRNRR